MTPLLFLAIAAAGGIGAGLRYAVDIAVTRAVGDRFGWGILVVNVSGSFALAVLTGLAVPGEVLWGLGTGLLGGYTTFSTVAVMTALYAEDRRLRAALGYAVGTLAGAVAAAALGLWLGTAIAAA